MNLALYFEYARMSFLQMLTYRVRYAIGVLTYLVHVAVYWFVWSAVYEHGDSFGGFTLGQMTTYISLGWVARSFYYNNIDWDIYEQVNSGKVALDLLKPVSFQAIHMARGVGESLFRLLLFALPSGLVVFSVFPIQAPSSIEALLGFILCTSLALLINLQLNFLVGLLAFRIRSVMGIMRAKYVAMQILTGLIVPISIYPQWAQNIFYLTPFPYIANVPLSSYLGKLSSAELINALIVQLGWWLLLLWASQRLWRLLKRDLVIQGG